MEKNKPFIFLQRIVDADTFQPGYAIQLSVLDNNEVKTDLTDGAALFELGEIPEQHKLLEFLMEYDVPIKMYRFDGSHKLTTELMNVKEFFEKNKAAFEPAPEPNLDEFLDMYLPIKTELKTV